MNVSAPPVTAPSFLAYVKDGLKADLDRLAVLVTDLERRQGIVKTMDRANALLEDAQTVQNDAQREAASVHAAIAVTQAEIDRQRGDITAQIASLAAEQQQARASAAALDKAHAERVEELRVQSAELHEQQSELAKSRAAFGADRTAFDEKVNAFQERVAELVLAR